MISNVCIIEVVNSSFWGLHDNRFLKNLQNNKLIFLSLGTLHTHSIINVQTCICIYQQVKIDRYNDRKKQRLCIILWVGVQKHKIPSACSNRSCSRGRHCWTVLPLLSIEQNKQAFKTFWQVLFKLKARREKKKVKKGSYSCDLWPIDSCHLEREKRRLRRKLISFLSSIACCTNSNYLQCFFSNC